jgi:cytochrome d ubiquinol oxidase subunit I
MYFLGWVDTETETTRGIHVPCLLSYLAYQDTSATVSGLESFPRDDWAPVDLVFQVYHLMIDLGMVFVAISAVAVLLWIWRRRLFHTRWMLWVMVASIWLAELATLSGWWTAELGRQPWVVWQILRTDGAESPMVTTAQVAFSIGMFVVLYAALGGVFLWLLHRRIVEGPPPPSDDEETASLPDSFGEVFRRRSRVSGGV